MPIETVEDLKAVLDASDRRVEETIHQTFREAQNHMYHEKALSEYRDQFVKDNPDYVKAFEKGELQPFFDNGMNGEEAWANYKLNHTKAEVETLQKQLEGLKTKETKIVNQPSTGDNRLDKAMAIVRELQNRKQERQAGAAPISSRAEQVRAGVELVERMRAGKK